MAIATGDGKRSSLAAVGWQQLRSQLKVAGRARPYLQRPTGSGIHSGSKAPTAVGAPPEGRPARKAPAFVDVTAASS